jgi:transposase
VAAHPDATLEELAQRLGHIASYVTVHRTLELWDLPLKKRRCEPQNKTAPT